MNKKTSVLLGAIALVAIGVAIYMRSPAPKPGDEAKVLAKVSVRMKWFYAGTMTGWFAGKEQGIFSKHGMDLTITPGGPDNNSVKLVAAGSDMFGVAGADEVLLARAKGIPVVAIGVLFKESPICFVSKNSRGIKTPKDWAAKTVEVSYGSNAEVQYRALVAKFRPENVKEVPYTFNLIPFIEDKVDVSVAYRMDQVVTLERKGIELSIITAKEYDINPYGDVVITTEAMLREKSELVSRFMQAVVESQKWAIEHPDEGVAYLVKGSEGLTVENERAVWQATIPFLVAEGGLPALCAMAPERWQETLRILVEYAGVSKDLDLKAAYKEVLK